MNVTGFTLRHAIRQAEHERDLAASHWDDSLNAFEDEKHASEKNPPAVMKRYVDAENRVCRLQTAQARLNLNTIVSVAGEEMTLCEAVKRVGGAGRAEKMWRAAAGGKKRDRYGGARELTRRTDEDRARRTIGTDAAEREAKRAARYAAQLRAAIETANAREFSLDDVDPSLFE